MRSMCTVLFVLLSTGGQSSAVAGVPTRIAVRVISQGGKFVGTSMGGALITIRDVDTGEMLARGVTSGSTGDTTKIMREPQPHHAPVATEGAAVFEAAIDLDEPRLVEVSAFGPLAQRQSANRASATQWVIPGKHVVGGDGVRLELRGFAVDVLTPPGHLYLTGTPQNVTIRANVTLMCGCRLEPGGLWDSKRLEMEVLLRREGGHVESKPLRYAGDPSQFEAELRVDHPGAYEAIVSVYDPANGATGVDRTTFVVVESN